MSYLTCFHFLFKCTLLSVSSNVHNNPRQRICADLYYSSPVPASDDYITQKAFLQTPGLRILLLPHLKDYVTQKAPRRWNKRTTLPARPCGSLALSWRLWGDLWTEGPSGWRSLRACWVERVNAGPESCSRVPEGSALSHPPRRWDHVERPECGGPGSVSGVSWVAGRPASPWEGGAVQPSSGPRLVARVGFPFPSSLPPSLCDLLMEASMQRWEEPR